MIVFPLAAGAVGNRFCSVGFLFLFAFNAEITNHSHTQEHSHELIVSLDVFLCSMYICLPTYILSMYTHLCVVHALSLRVPHRASA